MLRRPPRSTRTVTLFPYTTLFQSWQCCCIAPRPGVLDPSGHRNPGNVRRSLHAMADAPTRPAAVDFHFDVMCPFAYQTSKWIRAVRDQTGLAVTWRFFSLEEVNRVHGKQHPWEREWSYGW